MKDFNFYNPVKILFGRDKADEVGVETARFANKILLVYGMASIKQSGLYDRVKTSLRKAGVEAVDHGGVKSNPILSHAEEGIRKIKDDNLDGVVAVGGGSVMDEAKAIAAGAVVEHNVWDFLSGEKKPQSALPIITIPTLAASGSEMNGNTVIMNEIVSEKIGIYSPHLYPKVSILDPMLTVSVPVDYTVYGIADAFSHVVEPYFNGIETQTVLQDQLAEGLFRALIDTSRRLVSNLKDYNARADMMWASSIALAGVLAAGRGRVLWENHQVAHALGAKFDVPHGAALAVVMPGWMKYSVRKKSSRLAKFAVDVMGAARGADNEATAMNGIERFKEWLSLIGAPVTLEKISVSEDDLPDLTKSVVEHFQRAGMTSIGNSEAGEILRNCL
ncbi:MAG: iron-containing alcohol dehydrogenase [Nitrospinota bacterium]